MRQVPDRTQNGSAGPRAPQQAGAAARPAEPRAFVAPRPAPAIPLEAPVEADDTLIEFEDDVIAPIPGPPPSTPTEPPKETAPPEPPAPPSPPDRAQQDLVIQRLSRRPKEPADDFDALAMTAGLRPESVEANGHDQSAALAEQQREAAERAAQQEAERVAQERAAQREAERVAQERAAQQEAERARREAEQRANAEAKASAAAAKADEKTRARAADAEAKAEKSQMRDLAKAGKAQAKAEAKAAEAEARSQAKEAAALAKAEKAEAKRLAKTEKAEAKAEAKTETEAAEAIADTRAKAAAATVSIPAPEAPDADEAGHEALPAAPYKRSRRDRRIERQAAVLGLKDDETLTFVLDGVSRLRGATLMVTRYRVAILARHRKRIIGWIPLEEVNSIETAWRGAPTLYVGASIEHLAFQTKSKIALRSLIETLQREVRLARAPGGRRHHPDIVQDWCDRTANVSDSDMARFRLWVRRHPLLVLALLGPLVPLAYFLARG